MVDVTKEDENSANLGRESTNLENTIIAVHQPHQPEKHFKKLLPEKSYWETYPSLDDIVEATTWYNENDAVQYENDVIVEKSRPGSALFKDTLLNKSPLYTLSDRKEGSMYQGNGKGIFYDIATSNLGFVGLHVPRGNATGQIYQAKMNHRVFDFTMAEKGSDTEFSTRGGVLKTIIDPEQTGFKRLDPGGNPVCFYFAKRVSKKTAEQSNLAYLPLETNYGVYHEKANGATTYSSLILEDDVATVFDAEVFEEWLSFYRVKRAACNQGQDVHPWEIGEFLSLFSRLDLSTAGDIRAFCAIIGVKLSADTHLSPVTVPEIMKKIRCVIQTYLHVSPLVFEGGHRIHSVCWVLEGIHRPSDRGYFQRISNADSLRKLSKDSPLFKPTSIRVYYTDTAEYQNDIGKIKEAIHSESLKLAYSQRKSVESHPRHAIAKVLNELVLSDTVTDTDNTFWREQRTCKEFVNNKEEMLKFVEKYMLTDEVTLNLVRRHAKSPKNVIAVAQKVRQLLVNDNKVFGVLATHTSKMQLSSEFLATLSFVLHLLHSKAAMREGLIFLKVLNNHAEPQRSGVANGDCQQYRDPAYLDERFVDFSLNFAKDILIPLLKVSYRKHGVMDNVSEKNDNIQRSINRHLMSLGGCCMSDFVRMNNIYGNNPDIKDAAIDFILRYKDIVPSSVGKKNILLSRESKSVSKNTSFEMLQQVWCAHFVDYIDPNSGCLLMKVPWLSDNSQIEPDDPFCVKGCSLTTKGNYTAKGREDAIISMSRIYPSAFAFDKVVDYLATNEYGSLVISQVLLAVTTIVETMNGIIKKTTTDKKRSDSNVREYRNALSEARELFNKAEEALQMSVLETTDSEIASASRAWIEKKKKFANMKKDFVDKVLNGGEIAPKRKRHVEHQPSLSRKRQDRKSNNFYNEAENGTVATAPITSEEDEDNDILVEDDYGEYDPSRAEIEPGYRQQYYKYQNGIKSEHMSPSKSQHKPKNKRKVGGAKKRKSEKLVSQDNTDTEKTLEATIEGLQRDLNKNSWKVVLKMMKEPDLILKYLQPDVIDALIEVLLQPQKVIKEKLGIRDISDCQTPEEQEMFQFLENRSLVKRLVHNRDFISKEFKYFPESQIHIYRPSPEANIREDRLTAEQVLKMTADKSKSAESATVLNGNENVSKLTHGLPIEGENKAATGSTHNSEENGNATRADKESDITVNKNQRPVHPATKKVHNQNDSGNVSYAVLLCNVETGIKLDSLVGERYLDTEFYNGVKLMEVAGVSPASLLDGIPVDSPTVLLKNKHAAAAEAYRMKLLYSHNQNGYACVSDEGLQRLYRGGYIYTGSTRQTVQRMLFIQYDYFTILAQIHNTIHDLQDVYRGRMGCIRCIGEWLVSANENRRQLVYRESFARHQYQLEHSNTIPVSRTELRKFVAFRVIEQLNLLSQHNDEIRAKLAPLKYQLDSTYETMLRWNECSVADDLISERANYRLDEKSFKRARKCVDKYTPRSLCHKHRSYYLWSENTIIRHEPVFRVHVSGIKQLSQQCLSDEEEDSVTSGGSMIPLDSFGKWDMNSSDTTTNTGAGLPMIATLVADTTVVNTDLSGNENISRLQRECMTTRMVSENFSYPMRKERGKDISKLFKQRKTKSMNNIKHCENFRQSHPTEKQLHKYACDVDLLKNHSSARSEEKSENHSAKFKTYCRIDIPRLQKQPNKSRHDTTVQRHHRENVTNLQSKNGGTVLPRRRGKDLSKHVGKCVIDERDSIRGENKDESSFCPPKRLYKGSCEMNIAV